MAFERNPDDPSRSDRASEDLLRRRAELLDDKLQADPELAEGPASGSRIALFAIALVAILGAVFYGLNSSTTTPEPASTAQTTPAAPAGSNTALAPRPPAGQTTGQAPSTGQPAGQTTGAAPTPAQPSPPAPAPAPNAPAKQ